MKFSATTLALLLLPIVSLASPVPEAAEDAAPVNLVSHVRRAEDEVFKRTDEYCSIINVSTTVNCRAGPGTSYPVKGYAHNGDHYYFTCYKRGDCVNGNWSVHIPQAIAKWLT
jgi:hypothetical protein